MRERGSQVWRRRGRRGTQITRATAVPELSMALRQDAFMTIAEVHHVIERELALLSFQVRRSPQQVDELLDPDFREVGASGRMWTRAEMVAALPTLAGEPNGGEGAIQVTDMTGVLVSPDLVLLTYLSHWQGRRARRSSLWRRSAGTWRLLHHQGTMVEIS